MAAVAYHVVEAERNLPRARRTLKGFRRTHAGSSRLPLPDCVVAGLAATAMSQGNVYVALAIFAGMHLLGRPGEITAIRVADLHPPRQGLQQGMQSWTLTIADREIGKLSKTGTMDDTIVVDYPMWLGPLASYLKAATN